MEKNLNFQLMHGIGIIIIIILIAFVAMNSFQTSKTNPETNIYNPNFTTSEMHTLTSTGTAEYSTDPDELTILLGIEITELKAADSQQKSSTIMNKVINDIKNLGIAADEISTSSYRLDEIREWESSKNVFKGYKTTHTIKIKTSKLDLAGKIIDAATNAGANNVDSVSFGMSPEKTEIARAKVIELATQKAKEKANSLSKSLGITLKEIHSVSQQVNSYYPTQTNTFYGEAATGAVRDTPITPGEVSVSTTITIIYKI